MLETILPVFAARTAELVAVMKALMLLPVTAVDVDFAAFQFVGQTHNIFHILSADHGGQTVVGIIGSIQATEAIKILAGFGSTLSGRLLLLDAATMEFREMKLAQDPNCPVCGENPTITELKEYEQPACAINV